MSFRYFSKNGKILPISEATISLENINFQYGFGVYETLKVRNNILYFTGQHTERLLNSAKIITLEHNFTSAQISTFIKELIHKNQIDSCNIKMLLIGGKTAEQANLYIIPLAPLFPDRKLYTEGTKTMTVHYERFLPNAKTLNMLPSFLFYTKAKKNKCYDALLLDNNDNILEGTRTNFFAIKLNVLYTPPKEKILEGVTRQTVSAAAQKNGFTIREENIPLSDITNFDGAFLTSTSSKIIPIIQINNSRFPSIPPQLKELIKIYNEFLDKSGGIFNE